MVTSHYAKEEEEEIPSDLVAKEFIISPGDDDAYERRCIIIVNSHQRELID